MGLDPLEQMQEMHCQKALKKHLHGEKHTSGCKFSKVARFTNPIVAVKEAFGNQ